MNRNKRIFLVLLIAPPLLMAGVNVFSPPLSHEFDATYCTRYCHDIQCKHASENEGEAIAEGSLSKARKANISWLRDNPFGLGYEAMNLLVYVVFAPLLILLLIWGILRKGNG